MWNVSLKSHQSSVAPFRLHSEIFSPQLPACLKQPVLCSLLSDKLEEFWKLLPGLGVRSISTAAAVRLPWEGWSRQGGRRGSVTQGCATGLHLPRQGLSLLSPSGRLGIGVWFLGSLTELLATSCLCGSPGAGWVGFGF